MRARLGELPLDSALIDGELVHLEPEGTTSFSGLQDAISSGKTDTLNFFAFDLLYRDGWDLTGAALEDRKAALAEIISPQSQGMLRYSDHQIGRGPAFFAQACSFELEGIVSKRRTEPYRPGRSRSWLKVKCRNREEFVVVGFTDPEGSREGFGALLVGYYDPQGKLRYAGRVGTGFNTAQLIELHQQLESLAQPRSDGHPAERGVAQGRALDRAAPRRRGRIRRPGRRTPLCAKPRSRVCARTRTPREVVYDPKIASRRRRPDAAARRKLRRVPSSAGFTEGGNRRSRSARGTAA